MARKYSKWSEQDTARLVYLREVRSLEWSAVGKAMGRSAKSCEQRHWYLRHHVVTARRGYEPRPWPKTSAPRKPDVLPQQAAALPRTKSTMSTAALLVDAELRSRIETQGITAGLCGDPLPGRSALDKKRPSTIAR